MGQEDRSVPRINNLIAELWGGTEDTSGEPKTLSVMMAQSECVGLGMGGITYLSKGWKYFSILKTNMDVVLLAGWISAMHKGFFSFLNNVS